MGFFIGLNAVNILKQMAKDFAIFRGFEIRRSTNFMDFGYDDRN